MGRIEGDLAARPGRKRQSCGKGRAVESGGQGDASGADGAATAGTDWDIEVAGDDIL
nr:hypothetical protein [uncultured Acetatifactor sp.]